MRTPSLTILTLLSIPLIIGCGEREMPAADGRTDIPVFLISIDTLRSDRLSVYGYPEHTSPSLEAFRRDAILVERAFSNVPLTLPSHASILTGLQPYEHGLRDNIGYDLRPDLVTLPQILRQHGYSTGAAVSSVVLRAETGFARGFDFYDDLMTEAPVETISSWQRDGELTAQQLDRWIDSVAGKRIFAFLHLYEPHYPYTPPEPYASNLADAYDGEVAKADAIVGSFLEGLRDKGLYDDALIIILSDHGEGLGDHGELEHGVFLYREAIQVPLLVKLPGNERAGESIPAPVSLTDVLPTILARLGIELSDPVEGIDLLAANRQADRTIYSETYYPRLHYGWSELFSQIDDRHHLIDAPAVELFDYGVDPSEQQNLAPEQRRIVADMRDEIRAILAAHPFEEPSAADPEDLAKLESLGYLGGGGGASTGDRPDPKEKIGLLSEFGRGAAAFQRGELDQAIAIGRSIVVDNPDFLQAWGLISSASRRKGDFATALDALEAQMERSPGNPQTALALSSLCYELKRFDQARTYAELATDYAPSLANEMIARIELARGNPDAADEAALAAAEASPARAEPLMLRSLVAHERGDIAAELELLDRARAVIANGSLDPTPELEFRRGQALLRLRRTPEAEQAFRAETVAFPDHRMAWINLALAVGAQGRRAEAEAILNQALERHDDAQMRRLVAEARDVMESTR